MTPQMRVLVTATNDTKLGFNSVVGDANTASDAVAAAGQRAARGLMAQNQAMMVLTRSTASNAQKSANLVYQLNDVAVSLASGQALWMVAIQQGSQIATIYGPEEGGIGRALKETGNLATSLVTKFWPITAVIAAGTATIGLMTREINKAGKEQLSFGDVAMASWQVVSEGVYSLVKPAIEQIGVWFGQLWDWAAPGLKALGNGIVATMLGAFDAAKIAWGAFPAVMGDMAYTTANNVIGGIEFMINGAIGLLNDFIGTVNGVAGLKLDKVGGVDFEGLDNPYEGAMAGTAKKIADSIGSAFKHDYLGSAFDAIKDRAVALSLATDDVSKSAKGANDNVKKLATDGVRGLREETESFAEMARGAFSRMGTGLIEAWQKGGDVGLNVLGMLSSKVGQLGESLLNNGLDGLLNMGINALLGAFGGGATAGLGLIPGLGSLGGLRSFAGGGFTGPGARSGGLDGHGGFLSLLHPEETVVDHSGSNGSSSSSAGGPIFNFNITGSATDAAEIARVVRQEAVAVFMQMQKNPYRR